MYQEKSGICLADIGPNCWIIYHIQNTCSMWYMYHNSMVYLQNEEHGMHFCSEHRDSVVVSM